MSRALPASILPVLGYLIPLLGSDRDGEALGAARAIHRKLRAVGLDLHDLAASVAGIAPAVVDITPPASPPPRPKSRRAEAWRPPVHVHLTEEERATLRARLGNALCEARLGHFDRMSLASLADRLDFGLLPPTQNMLDRAEAILAELERVTA